MCVCVCVLMLWTQLKASSSVSSIRTFVSFFDLEKKIEKVTLSGISFHKNRHVNVVLCFNSLLNHVIQLLPFVMWFNLGVYEAFYFIPGATPPAQLYIYTLFIHMIKCSPFFSSCFLIFLDIKCLSPNIRDNRGNQSKTLSFYPWHSLIYCFYKYIVMLSVNQTSSRSLIV